MSFSKPLPVPRLPSFSELVSPLRASSQSWDFTLGTSPMSPGKFQQWLNLSPGTPIGLPSSTNMSSGSQTAGTASSSTVTANDTAVNETTTFGEASRKDSDLLADPPISTLPAASSDMAYPVSNTEIEEPLMLQSDALEIPNLESWLHENGLQSPTNFTDLQQQQVTFDFFAGLPEPEFDTDIFTKPATPIVASFSELEIDPLLTYAAPGQYLDQADIVPRQTYIESSSFAVQQQALLTTPYDTDAQLTITMIGVEPYQAPVAAMETLIPRLPTPLPQLKLNTEVSSLPERATPLLMNAPKRAPKTTKRIDNRGTLYLAEKPLKPTAHSHVRINNTTQGLSTRTGKINNFNPAVDAGYITPPQPDSWKDAATGLTFSYNKWGELLAPTDNPSRKVTGKPDITFTPQELMTYLTSPSRPYTHAKPTLFIQRTPADSARRYPTSLSSTCRLADCPARHIHGRKIGVGSFRVTIDERWDTHGDTVDPFVVAGYVHLYCLERWVGLRELVEAGVDIQVDERVIEREPRGRWAPGFGRKDGEARIAKDCLEALQSGDEMELATMFLSEDGEVSASSGYPRSRAYPPGARKPHTRTLVYKMTEVKLAELPLSKRKQMLDRGLKPSHILVHKGDLEVAETAWAGDNAAKRVVAKGKRKYRDVDEEIEYVEDEDDADDAAAATPLGKAGRRIKRLRLG